MHVVEALVDFGEGPMVGDVLVDLDLLAEIVYFCRRQSTSCPQAPICHRID